MKRLATGLVAAALVCAAPATASENYTRILDEQEFVTVTQGRNLALVRPFFLRDAVVLEVDGAGEINGTALRRDVTGDWRWENGYFCRDLVWGSQELGPNCQMVEKNGDRIRFTSDFGEGMSADFRID